MGRAQGGGQQVADAVRQLRAVRGEGAVAVCQADALDAVADVGAPVLRDDGHAAADAEQRAERCAGAVRVVAAVHGQQQRALEVPFPVEQAEDHKAHVGRGLEPAEVPAVLHERLAHLLPGRALAVGVDHEADAAGDAAVLRDLAQADVDQRGDVGDGKGGALHGGDEDGRPGALAQAVVDAGVLVGEADGLLDQRGIQAGPDLRANPGAVGVAPLLVVDPAGQRRGQPGAQVGLADAVFVPVRGNVAEPILGQGLGGDVLRAELIHGSKPRELQVQVVVGQGLARLGGEALDVQQVVRALVGRAQGSADVLADPAGVDSVAQVVLCKCDHGRLSSLCSVSGMELCFLPPQYSTGAREWKDKPVSGAPCSRPARKRPRCRASCRAPWRR